MPPSRLRCALPSRRSPARCRRSGKGWSGNIGRVFRSSSFGRGHRGRYASAQLFRRRISRLPTVFGVVLVASAVTLALVRVLAIRVAIILPALLVRAARIVSLGVPCGSSATFVLGFLFGVLFIASARALAVFVVAVPVSVAGIMLTIVALTVVSA